MLKRGKDDSLQKTDKDDSVLKRDKDDSVLKRDKLQCAEEGQVVS